MSKVCFEIPDSKLRQLLTGGKVSGTTKKRKTTAKRKTTKRKTSKKR